LDGGALGIGFTQEINLPVTPNVRMGVGLGVNCDLPYFSLQTNVREGGLIAKEGRSPRASLFARSILAYAVHHDTSLVAILDLGASFLGRGTSIFSAEGPLLRNVGLEASWSPFAQALVGVRTYLYGDFIGISVEAGAQGLLQPEKGGGFHDDLGWVVQTGFLVRWWIPGESEEASKPRDW
jgi:hypothetical protein